MWLLEKRFSQDWEIKPESIIVHDRNTELGKIHCEDMDRYVESYGAAGYVVIEGQNGNKDKTIILCAGTEEMLYDIYNACLECVMNHPHYIDLRKYELELG